MSTKKKAFIVVGVVALVLILVLAGVLIWVTRGLNYKNLKIGKVDLSKVPDGTYKGSFSGAGHGQEPQDNEHQGRQGRPVQ
jgi:flagellar basal body-associated protein FliL